MISWIARVLKGMIIALGFILPGVSGGVLAAILGIYERMIRFLAHIKENFVENVLYFTPVAIPIQSISCWIITRLSFSGALLEPSSAPFPA